MMLEIRKSSIPEFENAATFADLIVEYGKEAAIDGLPPPAVKMPMYRFLEDSGSLYVIGAFYEGALIGFVNILAPVLPHYGVMVAVAESFFVAKEFRKTGAGLKLLNAAKDYVKTLKTPGLLISAPLLGDLAEVLPHVGCVETNRVFFWKNTNDA